MHSVKWERRVRDVDRNDASFKLKSLVSPSPVRLASPLFSAQRAISGRLFVILTLSMATFGLVSLPFVSPPVAAIVEKGVGSNAWNHEIPHESPEKGVVTAKDRELLNDLRPTLSVAMAETGATDKVALPIAPPPRGVKTIDLILPAATGKTAELPAVADKTEEEETSVATPAAIEKTAELPAVADKTEEKADEKIAAAEERPQGDNENAPDRNKDGTTKRDKDATTKKAEKAVSPPPRFERTIAAKAAPPRLVKKTLELKKGMTLFHLLKEAQVPPYQTRAVIDALAKIHSPRKLRAGQEFELTFDDAESHAPQGKAAASGNDEALQLASLRFNLDPVRRIVVDRRRGPNDFKTEIQEKPLKKDLVRVQSAIYDSLFATAAGLGVPHKSIQDMIRIYAYDVDFQRDIRRGDEMALFYERKIDHEGRFVAAGTVVYASLTARGKKRDFYRFVSPQSGRADYYDRNGRSAKKFLMKSPVDGARLSSPFGMRRHPILGYNKMHTGVDFAAPRGTPIYAAGDGEIIYRGRKGPNGKLIRIRHANGYQTSYSHLSRYAKGIRKGKRVEQGSVIGYVGSTGRSTGPHLHYEVKYRGKSVNPMKLKFPTGKRLKGESLEAFKKERERIIAQMERTPDHSQIAGLTQTQP